MPMEVREQIKSLLLQRKMKLKDLSDKMSALSGKKYTPNSLTQRMGRGSITYNEVLLIAKILDYKVAFVDNLEK